MYFSLLIMLPTWRLTRWLIAWVTDLLTTEAATGGVLFCPVLETLLFETYVCWIIQHSFVAAKIPEVYPNPSHGYQMALLKRIRYNVSLWRLFMRRCNDVVFAKSSDVSIATTWRSQNDFWILLIHISNCRWRTAFHFTSLSRKVYLIYPIYHL